MNAQDDEQTMAGRLSGVVSRRMLLRGGLSAAGALLLQGTIGTGARAAHAAVQSGPGTTVMPYLLPSRAGVDVTALLTVRDRPADNGYRMVGIPDGLGLIPGGDRFTVLMNHELGATVGAARKHGSEGAFVSKWTIEKPSLKVVAGEDLVASPTSIYRWDAAGQRYIAGTAALTRLCSADLPDPAAFLNGTKGTSARLFMNGEETENGRAWATVATGPNAGQMWELPRLGRGPWENLVTSPGAKDRTIVVVMDDGLSLIHI